MFITEDHSGQQAKKQPRQEIVISESNDSSFSDDDEDEEEEFTLRKAACKPVAPKVAKKTIKKNKVKNV